VRWIFRGRGDEAKFEAMVPNVSKLWARRHWRTMIGKAAFPPLALLSRFPAISNGAVSSGGSQGSNQSANIRVRRAKYR